MVIESKPYKVEPGSELGNLLDGAPSSILLEKDGVLYRLNREDAPMRAVNPTVTRATILAGAGTLSAEDGERIKAAIYRAREEGTHPPSDT
jgi:hypothetical protein